MRSYSLSTAVDNRSEKLPRYRVIEPPLRPGSRRGFITISTTPTPKKDQEIHQAFDDDFSVQPSERAPSRWDVIKNRPLSGRSLFVEAVIAARNSNYFKNSQEIARERMENYRRRKLKTLASRRTMSAPVMKMRSALQGTKNQQEESHQKRSDKKGVQSTTEAEPINSNSKENPRNLKSHKIDSSIEGKQKTSENIRATSEGNLISENKRGGSKDQLDGWCLPSGLDTTLTSSSIEKKNSSTQDNSIFSAVEDENPDHEAERNEELNALRHSLLSCNERSKNVNKCNEFLSIETSKMSNVEAHADTVNPAPLIKEEVVSLDHTDKNKSSLKNKDVRSACVVETEPTVQETSGKTYLSLPAKTSRMSIRRHSSDDCEINNVSFHVNDTRNQDASKDNDGKNRVTLQVPRINILNRRMSHPPRLASFQGTDRLRRRKTLKNEDEVVYAYDARPDKSLAKGYRAMQMTVGGRQVKLTMPDFHKESGDIMKDRAKLNTKLVSFRGKN